MTARSQRAINRAAVRDISRTDPSIEPSDQGQHPPRRAHPRDIPRKTARDNARSQRA